MTHKSRTIIAIGLVIIVVGASASKCTEDEVANAVIALAKLPSVIPTDVSPVVDRGVTVGFKAVLRNQGYDDATKPFQVKMTVVVFGLPGGGAPLFKEQIAAYPAVSNPVPGHHGTAKMGPARTTVEIVHAVPIDANATYFVDVTVDPDDSVFFGANQPKTLHWQGQIKP